jgi:hypothetical protein
MHEGKSPLGKLRAFPLSLASGKSPLVRLSLSLFGFGLSELGVTDLKTGWISIKVDSGLLSQTSDPPPEHGFVLAAAHNLPPSLEKSNHYYLTAPPECHCQMLLRSGRLR